jgi:hypothetical protein
MEKAPVVLYFFASVRMLTKSLELQGISEHVSRVVSP